jgi:hypothetical protein
VNGITTFRSGGALTPTSSVSPNTGNRVTQHPDRIKDGNLPSDQRSRSHWFDTSAFVDPPFGRYGDSGPGVLYGPGVQNWDLSLFKNTKVRERWNVQFRWEMFNAFNHANLSNPSVSTADRNFGRITAAAAGRQIQAGLKLLF